MIEHWRKTDSLSEKARKVVASLALVGGLLGIYAEVLAINSALGGGSRLAHIVVIATVIAGTALAAVTAVWAWIRLVPFAVTVVATGGLVVLIIASIVQVNNALTANERASKAEHLKEREISYERGTVRIDEAGTRLTDDTRARVEHEIALLRAQHESGAIPAAERQKLRFLIGSDERQIQVDKDKFEDAFAGENRVASEEAKAK